MFSGFLSNSLSPALYSIILSIFFTFLCSIQNEDGNSHILQKMSATPVGSVTTESPLSEVGSQRRPASFSQITGVDTYGIITSSVLPDRKMFFGQAVHNNESSVVNNSLYQLPLNKPVTVFESFDSNMSLPHGEGVNSSHDPEETGNHSPSSKVTTGIKGDRKRRIVQSISADSALLPIRSGPFPDNEILDSSPGSLCHSPVLTRKMDLIDHHKITDPLGTHSSNKQTDNTKKDPFGSLVSLHDDSE